MALVYTGEGFKGEKLLAFSALALSIISSAVLINLSLKQKRHALLQLEEAEAKKLERIAKASGSSENESSADGSTTFTSKNLINLPNGTFKGYMSGFVVTIKDKSGFAYNFTTNNAVMARQVPVIVKVVDRIAHVKLNG